MKIIFLTLFSIAQFQLSTSDYSFTDMQIAGEYHTHSFDILEKSFKCANSENELDEIVDCTIRIKTEDMDIEVTFEDVSLWTCAKLKVGNWWNNTFN